MAGTLSDYMELKVLDSIFGNIAFPSNANLFFALFTAAPSDSGGGTEVTGGSYARKSMANNATNFPAAAAGAKSNGTVITFAQATASWGTVTHLGVFDASSGGNLLAWCSLTTSKLVDINDTFEIAVGDLDVTLD